MSVASAAIQREHVSIRRLSKSYQQKSGEVVALHNIDLEIAPEEIVSIVGGSGCGKSTLLRIIAGLESGFTGSVLVGNRPVAGPGLDRGVIFQDHRLLPWLTVWENIAFALAEGDSPESRALVQSHIDLVGLQGFEQAYPSQLSGGMAQRTSIARALVNRPRILLLDEPFGALDALTRIQLQQEILRIWQTERTTLVLVTHDIDEAVFLGDKVIILSPRPGTIKRSFQFDLPRPRQRNSAAFAAARVAVYREFFSEEEVLMEYAI